MSKQNTQLNKNSEGSGLVTEKAVKSVSNSNDNLSAKDVDASDQSLAKEINGPKGLEPTRYGDWESKGRCYDF